MIVCHLKIKLIYLLYCLVIEVSRYFLHTCPAKQPTFIFKCEKPFAILSVAQIAVINFF